ncbi:MAG: NAD(P)H:quinone oxidoreductase [Deltaproteobacteria bacterium]|nr:NAD(P)H:quinone oxidoreductase [Deltaproteobacteria bacterium]
MKVNIIFHSMYGHIYRMAEAMAEGAGLVKGAEVSVFQVRETLPDDIIAKMGATEAKKKFAHVPIATLDNLSEADGVIFGTPTRYGNMSAQMKTFIDSTGGLWMKDVLVGKVASVFTSTATQHGGQESTILSFHIPLLHLGFVLVGMPYAEKGQMTMKEITGGSPYGASTIAGHDGSRTPSENELNMARFQGRHVADITRRLTGGK